MIDNREVTVATCDACGKERLSWMPVPPAGYHGVVDHYPPNETTEHIGTTWYACSRRCIYRAIQTRLDEARVVAQANPERAAAPCSLDSGEELS